MKFRIIKWGNDRYEIQKKESLRFPWSKENIYPSEVEDKFKDDVGIDFGTQHLFLATEQMNKMIFEERFKKLKCKFKVIEEIEV